MFQDWANYYLLIGGASGSLIGLLFIVATLAGGRDREQMLHGTAIYTTPTVFYLSVVLVLSAAAMAPGLARTAAPILLLAGFVCVAHSAVIAWRFTRYRREAAEPPHWSDGWCYCIAPMVLSVLLFACGILACGLPSAAATATAVALMLMLLLSIRNAWDLVTWLAPQAKS